MTGSESERHGGLVLRVTELRQASYRPLHDSRTASQPRASSREEQSITCSSPLSTVPHQAVCIGNVTSATSWGFSADRVSCHSARQPVSATDDWRHAQSAGQRGQYASLMHRCLPADVGIRPTARGSSRMREGEGDHHCQTTRMVEDGPSMAWGCWHKSIAQEREDGWYAISR
jgi:hypothetical protein